MFVKMEFFIPEKEAPAVREALGKAGFGRVGKYDHCLAETRVTGHWRPLEGAQPRAGNPGGITGAGEMKVEFVCRADRAAEAAAVIRRLHPYEEPLILVIPLLNADVPGSTRDIG
jgi:hypothetical protein